MNAKTSHDAQHLHPRWPPYGAVGAERFGKPPASLDKSNLRTAQFPDLSEIDQRVFPLILNIRWKKKTRHTRRHLPLDRKCLHVNRKQSYILPIHISQTASVVWCDQMQEQKVENLLEIKLWSNFNIILKVWVWAGFVALFKFSFLVWGKFTLQRTSGGVSSWSKLMRPLDPLVLVQAHPLPTAQSSSPGNWWWPSSSIIMSFLKGFPFCYSAVLMHISTNAKQ